MHTRGTAHGPACTGDRTCGDGRARTRQDAKRARQRGSLSPILVSSRPNTLRRDLIRRLVPGPGRTRTTTAMSYRSVRLPASPRPVPHPNPSWLPARGSKARGDRPFVCMHSRHVDAPSTLLPLPPPPSTSHPCYASPAPAPSTRRQPRPGPCAYSRSPSHRHPPPRRAARRSSTGTSPSVRRPPPMPTPTPRPPRSTCVSPRPGCPMGSTRPRRFGFRGETRRATARGERSHGASGSRGGSIGCEWAGREARGRWS